MGQGQSGGGGRPSGDAGYRRDRGRNLPRKRNFERNRPRRIKPPMPYYLTVWFFLAALAVLVWVVIGDCEKSGK